jgi:ribonuclease-3
VDIELMENTDTNYKNKLLSWAQKNNHTIIYNTLDEYIDGTRKVFSVGVIMDGELIASGTGFNKKDAGQVASQKAIEVLNITP